MPYKINTQLGVGASTADLLGAAEWPDWPGAMIIVGHRPALGRLASLLLAGTAQPWSVKKGAVWWLRGRDREGNAPVALHAVMGPDGL